MIDGKPVISGKQCGANSMQSRNITNLFAGLILLIGTATAVSAQTGGAPTVTRPTSSAVSPNLSDLPTAHWAQSQNLKMVPAPKPLPPRGAGPGGTSPHDGHCSTKKARVCRSIPKPNSA